MFSSLEATTPTSIGEISRNSVYELHWTQLDLPGRSPPKNCCCGPCHPTLLAWFTPSSARDHRLRQFAAEFINPIAKPEQDDPDPRPTSPGSVNSDDSADTVDFEPLAKGQSVSKAEKETLRARLVEWRILRHKKRGSSKFLSPEVALFPRTLEALVSSSGKFLSEAVIGKKQILAVVKHWDFGTDEDFHDVAEIISHWWSIFVSATPKSQHRTHKRTRAGRLPQYSQIHPTGARRRVLVPSNSSGTFAAQPRACYSLHFDSGPLCISPHFRTTLFGGRGCIFLDILYTCSTSGSSPDTGSDT
ncbi:hypothetical protein DFH07DRAFT_769524 [Mycena maculata]|uniref:Uncharacterized protein n=1 Tax=Mycena maculata TaxID=230809 RepID=A0AAD7NMM7_9AGAR|nr:hypothetical protein DFH07DRAFT_769524 [Mycena maculata]